MNYVETVEFFQSLPVFVPRKVKEGETLFNLDAIEELLHLLGNPQKDLHYIHVGGTNGKGSTIAFLREILIAEGFQVGSFHSPAIQRITEQIQLNGEDIPEEIFARLVTRVRLGAEAMKGGFPSEYELMVATAFLYFQEMQPDVVILEVGLGGDFDATNIIPAPEVAAFASISFDHMEVLGDTLEKIASHKAGIIKPGSLVISYPQEPEVQAVLSERCRNLGCSYMETTIPRAELHQVHVFQQKFSAGGLENLCITMAGTYQVGNACFAMEIAKAWGNRRGITISESAIRQGLLHAKWSGRFQLIQRHPDIIVDGAHNLQGIKALRQSLESWYPGQKIIFVTGVLRDKEYEKMMREIAPLAKRVYTITPPNPRALPGEELAKLWCNLCQEDVAIACASVEEAIKRAKQECYETDVICVFGSLYFLKELPEELSGKLPEELPKELSDKSSEEHNDNI